MGSHKSEDAYELSSQNVRLIFEPDAQHAEITRKKNKLKS